MKKWLLILTALCLIGCSNDPLTQIYEGSMTENWQLARGTDIISGDHTKEGVDLSFTVEGEAVTVFISGLKLKSTKAADSKDLNIPEQVIKRKIGEDVFELNVDGTVSLQDGKVSMDLVGVPKPEQGLSGSYGLSFDGAIIEMKE